MDTKTNTAKKTETKDEQIKKIEEKSSEERIRLLEHHLKKRQELRMRDLQTISKLNRMLDSGLKELEEVYGIILSMIVIEHGSDDGDGGRTLSVPYLKPEEIKKYKFATEKETDADGKLVRMKLSVRPVPEEVKTQALKVNTEKE